jgi:peptidoglycan/xylan/chitin deacetylase (PgdA/CDA1 family)
MMRAVLMYHSIDDSGSAISVSRDVFTEHITWMARSGLRIVSLEELLETGDEDDRDAVALTFDDGFANLLTAARVLDEHGLTATVFVVTSRVGLTNAWRGADQPGIPTLPLLGWNDLERLHQRGFVVGAHTHTHLPLTLLEPRAVEEEMDRCVVELQARLGVSPRSFAYPYGEVNAAVASRAAPRVDTAVTTEFSVVRSGDSPAWIPRLDMYYFRHAGAIRRLGHGGASWWMNWVRLRRRARETVRPRWTPDMVWR